VVTFTPAPAVRKVVAATYCVGGPARVPHVVAQALLPARGVARLLAPDEPGRYRSSSARRQSARSTERTAPSW
jgi:hypothetical protein